MTVSATVEFEKEETADKFIEEFNEAILDGIKLEITYV
jgi:hypothetical protein